MGKYRNGGDFERRDNRNDNKDNDRDNGRNNYHPRNPAMAEAFDGASQRGMKVRTQDGGRTSFISNSLPPLTKLGKDGEDHINIAYFGNTDLGQRLEFACHMRWNHPYCGEFLTMYGYMGWLRSDSDDQLRFMAGNDLKLRVQRQKNRPVKHFLAMVMDGAYHRIRYLNPLYRAFYENELPLDCYQTLDSGLRIRNRDAPWIIEGYAEIQKAIHSDQEPNFDFLCDGVTDNIYESLGINPAAKYEQIERRNEVRNRRRNRNVRSNTADEVSHESVEPTKPPVVRGNKILDKHLKTYSPTDGYIPLIPVISEPTEQLFLLEFERQIVINGVTLRTGPVVTDVDLPLLEISDVPAFYEQGLQHRRDVVRAGPIMPKTFEPGGAVSTLARLNEIVFYLKADDTLLTYVPININLTDVTHSNNPDNTQEVIAEGNGRYIVDRQCLVYRTFNSIQFVGNNGLKHLREMVSGFLSEIPEAEHGRYQHCVFQLKLRAKISLDVDISMNVSGEVLLVGVATGGYEDRRKTTIIKPQNAVPMPLRGYFPGLYRGRPKAELQPVPKADQSGIPEGTITEVVIGSNVVKPKRESNGADHGNLVIGEDSAKGSDVLSTNVKDLPKIEDDLAQSIYQKVGNESFVEDKERSL